MFNYVFINIFVKYRQKSWEKLVSNKKNPGKNYKE